MAIMVMPLSESDNRARNKINKMVQNAVKKGVLWKSTYCQDCGVFATEKPLSAHHEDYNKPYSVEWLCNKCHGKRLRRSRRVIVDISKWPNGHIISDTVS